MASHVTQPSQTHCRPLFQHESDSSVSNISGEQSSDPESTSDNDHESMDYTGYGESIHCVGDEEDGEGYQYDQGEEDEEDEEQEDAEYQGQNIDYYHAAHSVFGGPPHGQTPYSLPPVQLAGPDADGGALMEPVNYLAIANLITTEDIDMEEAFETAYTGHMSALAPDDPGDDYYGMNPDWDTNEDLSPPDASDAGDNAEQVQQQLGQLGPGDDFEDGSTVWFPVPPLPAFVSPHVSNLNPGNYPLVEFLHSWSFLGARKPKLLASRYPWPRKVMDLSEARLTQVRYADLAAEQCDIQGIDWEDLGVTRHEARERRRTTYKNYTNQENSDGINPECRMPSTDSFFRFRRMDIKRNIHLSHFQLRNVLAAASRTRIFYTGSGLVHCFNPVSGEGKTAIRLPESPYTQVSTLAADHGVLVAGGFNGEYMVHPLDVDGEQDPSTAYDGVLTNHQSGITNHVQIFLSRQSASPRAAFASNDQCFRVLDIETGKILSEEHFRDPINCTALSPDRRLRVMVGDSNKVFVAAAEPTSGCSVLQELEGHRDFGFACDWADDGWTVASGFQDRLVNIWDARRWTNSSGRAAPVETIHTEMAGARSLRFSPLGSGKRVLVAAEEADFVNVIDAQTFRSKQTFDIFGEIGGTAFTNAGQDLVVLCTDRARGGLIQLERCGLGAEAGWHPDENPTSLPLAMHVRQRGRTFDWPRNRLNEWKATRESETKRRRKGAFLDRLDPF